MTAVIRQTFMYCLMDTVHDRRCANTCCAAWEDDSIRAARAVTLLTAQSGSTLHHQPHHLLRSQQPVWRLIAP